MKQCTNCQQDFKITQDDLGFYKKMKVPEPTHCPACRRQRRLAFRNERNLYHRNCDLCHEAIISVFPKDSSYTAYCSDCWRGDAWNALDHSRSFDFNQPFFEQFYQLCQEIPHIALHQDGTSENCKYVNYGMNNKSCYLSMAVESEDIYYSHGAIKSKSCIDCQKFIACELCYDCLDIIGCYNLKFSQDCQNCNDSSFLKDCIGCKNCFCSAGLRNKEYVWCNEQLSKEAYMDKLKEIELTQGSIKAWKARRDELSLKNPKNYLQGSVNQDSTGNFLHHTKNLRECYDCMSIEDIAYCDFCGMDSHDMYDCSYAGIGSVLCYEINGATAFNNCLAVYYGRSLQDVSYSQHCYDSSYLFGCFGLRHKKYCIFNKQYSQEEYEELVPKIIEHMKKTEEYGEFFPISISSFPYNETVAFEYFPLTKAETLEKNWGWSDQEKTTIDTSKIIPANKLPEKIDEIPDDILEYAIECEQSHRPFRIIRQELDFYRQNGLPIPRIHPELRHKNRMALRNKMKLWERQCDNCSKDIRTSYDPERRETVYCEQCYLSEVN